SLRSITLSVEKSFTSQANRVVYLAASKRVIGPAPEVPAMRLVQNTSVLLPSGETTPVPVTSTRFDSITFLGSLSGIGGHAEPGRAPTSIRSRGARCGHRCFGMSRG